MPEYIEREAVYDVFTAKQQELLKFYRYYQLNDEAKEEFDRYDRYLNEIEAIPTADVVEVVRCKDCVFSRELDKYEKKLYLDNCVGCCFHSKSYCSVIMEDTDFCSCGKRKEGAE